MAFKASAVPLERGTFHYLWTWTLILWKAQGKHWNKLTFKNITILFWFHIQNSYDKLNGSLLSCKHAFSFFFPTCLVWDQLLCKCVHCCFQLHFCEFEKNGFLFELKTDKWQEQKIKSRVEIIAQIWLLIREFTIQDFSLWRSKSLGIQQKLKTKPVYLHAVFQWCWSENTASENDLDL